MPVFVAHSKYVRRFDWRDLRNLETFGPFVVLSLRLGTTASGPQVSKSHGSLIGLCCSSILFHLRIIDEAKWRTHEMREAQVGGVASAFYYQPLALFSTWLFHTQCSKSFKLCTAPSTLFQTSWPNNAVVSNLDYCDIFISIPKLIDIPKCDWDVPYSGKFSRGPIFAFFAVFAVDWQITKIKPTK